MRKIISLILIFIVVFFAASASKVSAKVLSNEKGTVTVAKNEIINDDLFIKAQTAEVDGVVNGDVFIGAQTVRILGTVNGNLHIGAQTVNVTGSIKGSGYIGAQNITVSGANIGGSLFIGCQNFSTDDKTIIGGSLFVGAADVNINSIIKRNVFVGTGNLSIGGSTFVGKDLYYAVGQNQGQANISPSAKIAGSVHKSEAEPVQNEIQTAKTQGLAFFRTVRLFASIISYLGALIIGFFYMRFFEKHLLKTASTINDLFWKSLGVGFLITIAFIPGVMILLFTLIGIPIAALATLALLIFVYLAKIVVGFSLGKWMVKKFNWKMTIFTTFAFGLLVFYLIRLIPFIGGIAGLVVLWTGLGAIILSSFSSSK